MIAAAILMLAVGAALVMVTKGWRNYSSGVNMQRDAQIAMRIMDREIRNSNISEIHDYDDRIEFIPNGTTRTNAYVYQSSEIASSPDVQLVSWTRPVLGSNSVEIAFTLKTAGGVYQKNYTATIHPRNEP